MVIFVKPPSGCSWLMEGSAEKRRAAGLGAGSCFTSPLPVFVAMGSTVFSGWGMPERWTWADWPGRWITALAPGSALGRGAGCWGSWMYRAGSWALGRGLGDPEPREGLGRGYRLRRGFGDFGDRSRSGGFFRLRGGHRFDRGRGGRFGAGDRNVLRRRRGRFGRGSLLHQHGRRGGRRHGSRGRSRRTGRRLDDPDGSRGPVERQGRGFFTALVLGVKGAAKEGDLIVREVGAVALPGDAQALFEHLDDIVVAHALIFGELVDAQHERAYLDRWWDTGEIQLLAYSPKRSCTASIRRKARS